MDLLNIILVLGCIVAAAAVGLICAVGLIVWLAGGRPHQHREGKTV
jgi:hypothetical protein